LGVELWAETEALVARIRKQQLERFARREPARPFGHRRLTTPFIGRKSEHGALVRAYQRAGRGGAQVVALLGEAKAEVRFMVSWYYGYNRVVMELEPLREGLAESDGGAGGTAVAVAYEVDDEEEVDS
jgi:hypothetical protein